MSYLCKVKKDNEILQVGENKLASYLAEGYDQIDEGGNIVKKATGGRLIPLGKYNQLLAENEKLKAEIAELKKPEAAEPEKSETKKAPAKETPPTKK